MADEPVQKPARDKQFTAVFALCMTLTCCAVLVLATPRVLVPYSLPPLSLDSRAVAATLAADAKHAASAPRGADVAELEQRYLAELQVESGPPIERRKILFYRQERERLAKSVFERVGAEGIKALRAQAVVQFMQDWSARSGTKRMQAPELGALPKHLASYGMLDANGKVLAPELCLRASFKARWNLIHALPFNADFTQVEEQAFEGWLALHAEGAPNERRVQAVRAYQAAGGYRGSEALAIWLHRIGQSRQALVYMQRAHLERADLFTRNYALGLAGALL